MCTEMDKEYNYGKTKDVLKKKRHRDIRETLWN